MEYRVTEQVEMVVEYSYDIEAATEEQAQEKFEALEGDKSPIDTSIIRKHIEIVSVEELG